MERTLNHEPFFGRFTRSLKLPVSRPNWLHSYERNLRYQGRIFALFPKTTKLCTNLDFQDIFLRTGEEMSSHLTKIVNLNQLWASNSELNLFIALFPRLNHLTITPGTVNFKSNAPENQDTKLSITELVFSWFSKIYVLALQDMLSRCPSLKLLSCGLPLRPNQLDYHDDDATYEVSSSSIQIMLEPVAKILTNLALSAIGQNRNRYDGTVLDLSHFSSLKKLRVSLSLFVSPDAPATGSAYRLLPKSLEVLQVSLESESTCPCHVSLTNFKVDLNFDKVKEILDKPLSVEWILEIARDKNIYFSSLRRIKFLGEYDKPETIDKCDSLQEAFLALEQANIVSAFSCLHITYPGQERVKWGSCQSTERGS